MVEITCDYCGEKSERHSGHVNRAIKDGRKLYCNKLCSGLGRRTTKADKVEVKRLYDVKYREENKDKIDAKNIKYNESPAGRAMQKKGRDKRKEYHLEYCRTDEYKAWKHEYDKKYNAKKVYGEFWECFLLANEISDNVVKYEARIINQTHSKSQKRKRKFKSINN